MIFDQKIPSSLLADVDEPLMYNRKPITFDYVGYCKTYKENLKNCKSQLKAARDHEYGVIKKATEK